MDEAELRSDGAGAVIIQVRATAEVPLALAVTRVLGLLTTRDLDLEAAVAVTDIEPALIRAGVAGVTKQVAVQTLTPTYYSDRVVIPMRWLATGSAGDLFPTLDANLELLQADAAGSELLLTGSYQPPFGRAGAVVDQVLLHRVAEHTLSRFLVRVVEIVSTIQPVERPAYSNPRFDFGLQPDT